MGRRTPRIVAALILLSALIVGGAGAAQARQTPDEASDYWCQFNAGVVTDADGNPVAGAEVVAMVQPDEEAMREIPDGGEFIMPMISSDTTNENGRYWLAVSGPEVLSELANGGSTFNFVLFAYTDDAAHSYEYESAGVSCIFDPYEEVEATNLSLTLQGEPSRSANISPNAIPLGVCHAEHIGEHAADVGRIWNHSTTATTATFMMSPGSTTFIGTGFRVGEEGVASWSASESREIETTGNLPFDPVDGFVRAAAWQVNVDLVQYGCVLVDFPFDFEPEAYSFVQVHDLAGGARTRTPLGYTPEFSNDDEFCEEYEASGMSIGTSRAETFSDGIQLGAEYGSISMETRTGYSNKENIVFTGGEEYNRLLQKGDTRYRVCGLHNDPNGTKPGPGLVIIRDAVEDGMTLEYRGNGSLEKCAGDGIEGIDAGHWTDFRCRQYYPGGPSTDLWVKH